MTPEETVRDYYEALRRGEPLYPYFAERDAVVKFGIGERLTGFEEVREGLLDQTRTTEDWRVESRRLLVGQQGEAAWFSDDVTLAWTDALADERRTFETRWSGTLVPADDEDAEEEDREWQFVGVHVSVAVETDG